MSYNSVSKAFENLGAEIGGLNSKNMGMSVVPFGSLSGLCFPAPIPDTLTITVG